MSCYLLVARRKIGSRTESIEDDEMTGHLAASETRGLLPESIETASEKYNSESVDSFGSQMSQSSSFVSMGTPPSSMRPKVGASAALQHTPPARVPLSAVSGRAFSTPPQQSRGMLAMTPLSQWSSLTPSQPTSTWRPVTLALHSSLLTPKSAPERRTLTSQRPAAVPQTASILRLQDLPGPSGRGGTDADEAHKAGYAGYGQNAVGSGLVQFRVLHVVASADVGGRHERVAGAAAAGRAAGAGGPDPGTNAALGVCGGGGAGVPGRAGRARAADPCAVVVCSVFGCGATGGRADAGAAEGTGGRSGGCASRRVRGCGGVCPVDG
ncbi:hypothetical protein DL89DRAFT_83403 [Linderina pennispora]|uniref:Uncharacterized protein n=1 Tax=Linderina pennispora TaxID=61395 RepID=A0A1Y1WHX1_9FUNG|nr:uncharacterized protein DL89DRAFT_83403 [Linderina pennispora]ORX72826.1 hypothetical protein DL89DRAFT_83403 [Linderina pennispora]